MPESSEKTTPKPYMYPCRCVAPEPKAPLMPFIFVVFAIIITVLWWKGFL